jgi:hypothetical protein
MHLHRFPSECHSWVIICVGLYRPPLLRSGIVRQLSSIPRVHGGQVVEVAFDFLVGHALPYRQPLVN